MSKYKVSIESTQVWVYVYEVEADSLEQAEKKAKKLYGTTEDVGVDNWLDSDSFVIGSALPIEG